jgi:hypothetical protein
LKITFRNREGLILTETERSCLQLTETATAYLDGSLPYSETDCLKQHLSQCSGCRTYLTQMNLTVWALGAMPRIEIPDAVKSNLVMAFRSWKCSSLCPESEVRSHNQKPSIAPPGQEGWTRHQEKWREASSDGADGVVVQVPKNI